MAIGISVMLWALGGLLLIALAVDSLGAGIQKVDITVWQWAVDWETAWLVALAKVFDVLGSTWVIAPVMVVVALYLFWRRRWSDLSYWVIAMVVSQLLIGPLKTLYARPRPPMSLVETTSYSFPSGHAVAGAAVAIALVIVLFPAGPRRRNLEMAAALFALVMGWSRIYLRAHWMSDAAAGVALGAAVAIGAAALVQIVESRSNRT